MIRHSELDLITRLELFKYRAQWKEAQEAQKAFELLRKILQENNLIDERN